MARPTPSSARGRSKGQASRPHPTQSPKPKITTQQTGPRRVTTTVVGTQSARVLGPTGGSGTTRTGTGPVGPAGPMGPSPRPGTAQAASGAPPKRVHSNPVKLPKRPPGKAPVGKVAPTLVGSPGTVNFPPHPLATPLDLHGGVSFNRGYIQRIKQSTDPSSYRFNFLYNPATISISTDTNVDVTQSPRDVNPNLSAGAQTITFSTLLNRLYEQSPGIDGQHLLSNQAIKELRTQGTLSDIEALYRVINGPPVDLYSGADTGTISAVSADVGFLQYSPVDLYFSPTFAFVGIISSVAVTHQSFNASMVPLLSQLDITLTRISSVKPPQTSAAPPADGSSP